jgi:gliding motility-associated-like protein
MKYLFKYFFLFFFFSFHVRGQINLVPNQSFEDTVGQCSIAMGLTNMKCWYRANLAGTPDLYNVCSNTIQYPAITSVPYNCRTYQYPQNGDFYIGLFVYELISNLDSSKIQSENIAVKLRTPLKANSCYYGEMFVNLGNISNLGTNQISMLFTPDSLTMSIGSFTNSIQPQIQWDTTQYFTDTLNWVKISGQFIANGGEQYLTIGNFKDGTHLKKTYISTNFIQGACATLPNYIYRTYYNIDNVSLYELPTPQLQTNAITICPNADSLVLGDTARIQTHYQWFANGTAIDTTSYIKVKPTQTTTYVLQSTNCTTNTQTIVVTYSNNCIPPEPIVVVEPIIPNVFTPNSDSINDVWRFSLGKGNTLKDIAIFNRWGNILYQKTNNLSQTTVLWDGRTTSGEETPNGVYFYVFQYTDANGDEHKKNGYITLIR